MNFSPRVFTPQLTIALFPVLLALTQAGVSREDAYSIVQASAMRVWKDGGQLLDYLKKDKKVTGAISDSDLEALFDMGYHLKHVDTIFKRVFD